MPTFGVIYLKLYINISTHRNSTHRLPGVGALLASFSTLIRMFLMNSPRYTASTTQDTAGSVYIFAHQRFLTSFSSTATVSAPQLRLHPKHTSVYLVLTLTPGELEKEPRS